MIKHFLLCTCSTAWLISNACANDSTGYVATGGVEYIQNKNIQMYSEDLYLSPERIRVAYEFKNLTDKAQTETVLFPMPKVIPTGESPMADASAVANSFKIWINNRVIHPKTHVRAFVTHGENAVETDVTALLNSCGFSDREIAHAWYNTSTESSGFKRKLRACAQKDTTIAYLFESEAPKIKKMMPAWSSQLIYSWKQNFPANTITRVRHEYKPLLGGGVSGNYALSMDEESLRASETNPYCFDDQFISKLKKYPGQPYYKAFGYVLKTGANWATSIKQFKLTIDHKPNELVSLCWDDSLKKISPTRFEAKKDNFIPTQDINLFYVVPD